MPVAVHVEPLATRCAPQVVPKVPISGATRTAPDVKVTHAAPRAIVPRARVELVAWPRVPHRYLDAYPGS